MSSTCSKSSNNIFMSPHPSHDPTRVAPLTARSKNLPEVTVVDCKSCRQLYLRSAYTFSREKEAKHNNVKERTKKCMSRIKRSVSMPKGLSSASLCCILRRLLACTSTANVRIINRT